MTRLCPLRISNPSTILQRTNINSPSLQSKDPSFSSLNLVSLQSGQQGRSCLEDNDNHSKKVSRITPESKTLSKSVSKITAYVTALRPIDTTRGNKLNAEDSNEHLSLKVGSSNLS